MVSTHEYTSGGNAFRTALRGPIAEIIALTPVKRAYAEPNDCPGCSLEFVPGVGWCGHLGSLVSLAGLPTANLTVGRVTALVAGAENFFSGAGWISGPSVSSDGAKFQGEVVSEINGKKIEYTKLIARMNVSANTAYPTTETDVSVTVATGMAFEIPPNTLVPYTGANAGKGFEIRFGFGTNFKLPTCPLTIRLRRADAPNTELMRWHVDPRKVGKFPSGLNSCLEMFGWLRGQADGDSDGLPDTQSHAWWLLLGYTGAEETDPNLYGGAAYEIYPGEIDNSVAIPLKLTIQWAALTDLQRCRYLHKRFWIPTSGGDIIKTRRTDGGSPPSQSSTNMWAVDADLRRNALSDIASDGTQLLAISSGSGLISFSRDGVNWLGSDSGQSQALYGAEFVPDFGTDGLWVVVGANGTVLTSPSGRKWTARTTGTTSVVRNIRYGSSVGAIAPILGSGQYLQSNDGITWNLVQVSGRTEQYRGIAINGSAFLLCGSSGRISYWSGSAWTHSQLAGSPVLREAVYDPISGKWSVYGDTGTIAYATNPAGAWTVATASGLTGTIQGGVRRSRRPNRDRHLHRDALLLGGRRHKLDQAGADREPGWGLLRRLWPNV